MELISRHRSSEFTVIPFKVLGGKHRGKKGVRVEHSDTGVYAESIKGACYSDSIRDAFMWVCQKMSNRIAPESRKVVDEQGNVFRTLPAIVLDTLDQARKRYDEPEDLLEHGQDKVVLEIFVNT